MWAVVLAKPLCLCPQLDLRTKGWLRLLQAAATGLCPTRQTWSDSARREHQSSDAANAARPLCPKFTGAVGTARLVLAPVGRLLRHTSIAAPWWGRRRP